MIDITRPGIRPQAGREHILTRSIRELETIFRGMGFDIIIGTEADTEFYNFDALNVPRNHPSRDAQDTFWIDGPAETVLRSHCTASDIHYMQDHQPPMRALAPGRVFRNEATDATHEARFHQWDGMVVGENISLANLKWVLGTAVRRFLGDESIGVRLRPGFFPFVEPGVELDLTCFKCDSKDEEGESSCNVCKGSGWIELLGAGMLHPNVLRAVNIDPEKYQALAFGPGLERLVMLKYGVDDIRDFYDGDIPFLKQF